MQKTATPAGARFQCPFSLPHAPTPSLSLSLTTHFFISAAVTVAARVWTRDRVIGRPPDETAGSKGGVSSRSLGGTAGRVGVERGDVSPAPPPAPPAAAVVVVPVAPDRVRGREGMRWALTCSAQRTGAAHLLLRAVVLLPPFGQESAGHCPPSTNTHFSFFSFHVDPSKTAIAMPFALSRGLAQAPVTSGASTVSLWGSGHERMGSKAGERETQWSWAAAAAAARESEPPPFCAATGQAFVFPMRPCRWSTLRPTPNTRMVLKPQTHAPHAPSHPQPASLILTPLPPPPPLL